MESGGESFGGWERRRAKRHHIHLQGRWEGEMAAREATVTDISTCGCFVLTDDLVKRGETVKLEMRLPRGGRITLWGRVVYQVEDIGFALDYQRFEHDDDRKRLEWLVRAEEHRTKG
jgi:hypothetical protein